MNHVLKAGCVISCLGCFNTGRKANEIRKQWKTNRMKILKVTTLFIYFLHVRITGGSMLVDGAVWMGSLHCEDFGWHLPCVDTAGFGTLKPDFSWNETTFEEPWASLVTLLAYFCFYIHSWHFCILSYTREPLTSNVILLWSAKEHALISTRILTCSNRWNC